MGGTILKEFLIEYMIFLPLPLLIIAAVFDLRERRIPNWVTYITVISPLALHVVFGQFRGLINSFSGLIFVTLIFSILPGLRLGGGDLKLAAGIGAWIGFDQVLWFVFYTFALILAASITVTCLREGRKGVVKRLQTEIKTLGTISLPLAEVPGAPVMLTAYLLLAAAM